MRSKRRLNKSGWRCSNISWGVGPYGHARVCMQSRGGTWYERCVDGYVNVRWRWRLCFWQKNWSSASFPRRVGRTCITRLHTTLCAKLAGLRAGSSVIAHRGGLISIHKSKISSTISIHSIYIHNGPSMGDPLPSMALGECNADERSEPLGIMSQNGWSTQDKSVRKALPRPIRIDLWSVGR